MNKAGGRGKCQYCHEWHNNVAYHEVWECEKSPNLLGKNISSEMPSTNAISKTMTENEEKHLIEALKAARTVQEFLWGEYNSAWTIEEWKRMFKKRIVKIDDISPDNPHAIVELKKRLLQNAALSIALLAMIDKTEPPKECSIPSNLPQYA